MWPVDTLASVVTVKEVSRLYCPKCNTSGHQGNFCKDCGTKNIFSKFPCPHCEAPNWVDAVFCEHCGRPVHETAKAFMATEIAKRHRKGGDISEK